MAILDLISVNFLNIIINNEFYEHEKDLTCLIFDKEDFVLVDSTTDVFDLLVKLDVFPSKGQARKNWTKGSIIENGYNEILKIGKMHKALYIWKPVDTRHISSL